MAHIPDGVLSGPVLAAGAILSAGLVAVAIRRFDYEHAPQTAILAAAFFTASLLRVPIGPASAHPLMVGLIGMILGPAAPLAILIALALQAAFFGFGGLIALGVNVFNIAAPALLVGAVFGPLARRATTPRAAFAVGAAAGLVGVALVAALVSAALALSAERYVPALGVVAASYGPLAVVEAALTGAAVALFKKVKPEMLSAAAAADG